MKKRKVKEQEATVALPRMICYHRYQRLIGKGREIEQGARHCLAWLERRAGGQRETVAVHVLYTEDAGGVKYDRLPGAEAAYLVPSSTSTTAEDFETYLRGRLERYGGPPEAYEALGVPRPLVVAQVAPGSQKSHDELYERAAKLLGVSEEDLRAKYGHLNPGLQAMNLRNRLRGKGHNV